MNHTNCINLGLIFYLDVQLDCTKQSPTPMGSEQRV